MDAHTRRWQIRMAPLMVAIVMGAAIFFAIVTILRFSAVETRLNAARPPAPVIDWLGSKRPATMNEQLALANSIARYEMEREIVARRYDTAELAFSTRLWTRLMGFLSGMILAFVGAVFVLGKLESENSELGAQSAGLTLSLKSASPGVIMAGLGTFLMGLSISIPAAAETKDGAVYLLAPQAGAATDPPITSALSDGAEPPLRGNEVAP